MIHFNNLLREAGIPLGGVKLVRHQDARSKAGQTIYQLWRQAPDSFERYQSIQSEPKFTGAKYIASFVVTPLGETLFVGLYEVTGVTSAPKGTIDPVSGEDVGGHHLYSLTPSSQMEDYKERLFIDWGPGFRTWVQNAESKDKDRKEKQVLEIRRAKAEAPFPGFLNFREKLSALHAVPFSWRQTLSSVRGVYLLSCLQTGKQYVGSAGGEGGFWGRWEEYVASGHGGNVRLIDVLQTDYWVSILEVASSLAGVDELIASENRWKEKLGSRIYGFNAN